MVSRFLTRWMFFGALIFILCCAQERKQYIPKCPEVLKPRFMNEPELTPPYCHCLIGQISGSIRCDFNNTEDVLLTGDIYPFRNSSLQISSVRFVNAISVHVTKEFLKEFMQVPSMITLDVVRAQTLILDSMPEQEDTKQYFFVNIESCFVPEVPRYFMRDRSGGALRITSSHVGNFHEGVLHNMKEMLYLIFEDSRVDLFEGSVASEGYITFSKWNALSTWSGLRISNVTIDTISSGTFNLKHKWDMVSVTITKNRIGSLNTKGLVVAGDIDVTIQNNVFQRMETEAFEVAVTGNVVFDKNDIANWEVGALDGLICHNRTSLEENIFRVDDPTDIAMNITTTPFHITCGNPQLFLVISQQHPLIIKINSTPAWALGFVLAILILTVVLVGIYSNQRQNILLHFYRSWDKLLFSGFRERKLSQVNLPNGAEIDPSAVTTIDGMSNPNYVNVNETS